MPNSNSNSSSNSNNNLVATHNSSHIQGTCSTQVNRRCLVTVTTPGEHHLVSTLPVMEQMDQGDQVVRELLEDLRVTLQVLQDNQVTK